MPIFLCGYLLHILVERRRNFGHKFIALYLFVAGAIYTVDSKDLISAYKEQSSDIYELYGGKYIREGESLLLGTSEPVFILHGDSYARELVQALVDRGLSFITNNKDGCYSIGLHSKIKVESDSNSYELELKCNNFYKRSKLLANHYQNIPIVVAQNWTTYGKSVPLLKNQNDMPFHLIDDFDSLVEPSKHEQFLYTLILSLLDQYLTIFYIRLNINIKLQHR